MRKLTLFYFGVILMAILPASGVKAQSASWFTPLDWGLIPIGTDSSNIGGRYDDIFFISHDTGVLVSSYGMIFKTYDGAFHWYLKKAISANTYFRSVEFSGDGQVGIAGTLSGTVYRSNDRGETWNDISANISDTGSDAKRICGLGHWGNIFYGVGWWGGTTARFYKSMDTGVTWTTSYIDTSLASGLVDIAFLSANNGFITGYHAYNGKRESIILHTLDGGNTWTKVFSDTIIGGRIWKIQFIDSLYGVASIEPMYADTVAMIKTTDGGNTWQLMTIGHVNAWNLPGGAIGTQGVGFINRQTGWVGGYYNGMFQTNDGGITWDTLGVNLECDRFFLIDSTMYVSANTVYKYSSDHSNQVGTVPAPSYVHKLYPVAPNPSNGMVQIEFDINAHQTNVVLDVVNVDGRKTYSVMKGYLKPGHYSYTWDGTSAANGNYIVWLGTDEIPMAEKFVLDKH